MVRKVFAIFILVGVILALNVGLIHKKDSPYNLSDLGGVFSSVFTDLDIDIEITGKLSEGAAKGVFYEQDPIEATISEDGSSNNRLLRWGISRRTENQPPAADPGAPELLARYGGRYIGDTSQKEIYLTFDEGYENGYTPKILDVLRDNQVKAVFFITGPYLKEHQDLVRRMVEEGHEVGNHTIHHPSLPGMGDRELEEEVVGLDRAFNEKFGRSMKYLRPPKGEYSERTLSVTQGLGYVNLFWSFAYDDWYRDKVRGSEYAYNKVMQNLHNGAILLLHAVSKDNADALEDIIKGAKEKGYRFGDINELIVRRTTEMWNM